MLLCVYNSMSVIQAEFRQPSTTLASVLNTTCNSLNSPVTVHDTSRCAVIPFITCILMARLLHARHHQSRMRPGLSAADLKDYTPTRALAVVYSTRPMESQHAVSSPSPFVSFQSSNGVTSCRRDLSPVSHNITETFRGLPHLSRFISHYSLLLPKPTSLSYLEPVGCSSFY